MDYHSAVDWQQITALVIVSATAALFLLAGFRRRRFRWERDTHCGCSNPSASSASIRFHARKGERPQILVRAK